MEELLSDSWEVELELINWRSWPPRPSTTGPAHALARLGKWLPRLLLAAVRIFWYSLLLGEVVGWGGKSCLSREGTVSWSFDVPVVVALVVALSSQGRTFVLSPSHCQHCGKGNREQSQPVSPPPSFLMGTLG